MAKKTTITASAFEKLRLKYARPKSVFQEFSGAAYCRRIASSVGAAFDVSVVVQASATQVNMQTKQVTLNESQVLNGGDDFAVGLILHEVGHLKHTPLNVKYRDGWHHELHNLLEDVRMESLVKKEYAGAPYFIDTINDKAIARITEQALMPVDITEITEPTHRFYTVVKHAYPRAYGTDTSSSFSMLEPLEAAMSEAATVLAGYMRESEGATSDRCIELAGLARDLMQQFLAPPPPEPQPQQGQGVPQPSDEQGKQKLPPSIAAALKDEADRAQKKAADKKPAPAQPIEYDIQPAADKVRLLKRIENGDGPKYSLEDNYTEINTEPHRYEQADGQARMYAANLKRKIISKLRANDRTKLVPNQRHGRLNKRTLVKAALGNPRVYQQRLQPKKRSYVASVILDTSGSMWSGAYNEPERIDLGMQASSMLVRTLRALNVPTSLSIYGTKASERVSHADRYLVPETSRDMAELTSQYYRANHTNTHEALTAQLPKLRKVAHGREQLLIIITDGSVPYRVGEACRQKIREAQRHSVIHPMIFYVATKGTILNDKRYERHLTSAAELPAAAADLLANIQFHG